MFSMRSLFRNLGMFKSLRTTTISSIQAMPRLEPLEDRLSPASLTWLGNANDPLQGTLWKVAGNWQDDATKEKSQNPPGANDSLSFTGIATTDSTNTTVGQIASLTLSAQFAKVLNNNFALTVSGASTISP